MRARRPVGRVIAVAAVAVAGVLALAPQAVADPVAPAQTTTAPSPEPTPTQPAPPQTRAPDPAPVPVPSWSLAPGPDAIPQVVEVPRGGIDTGGGSTVADQDRSGTLLLAGFGLAGAAGAVALGARTRRRAERG